MKGGRDEEKVISPMFPRLHVNDTERGGPRAPPRNKMALYEQLSIPSQRFGSGSASTLPRPPSNGTGLVPSTSSSTHGGCRERSPFTPFCNSPAPSHSTEKLHSYSSSGANLNSKIASHDSKKPTDYPKSLNATRPLQLISKGHSFQPPNFSNFRNSSLKKHGGEDVVTAPTFARSGVASHCTNSTQHGKDREQQFPLFCTSSSVQLQDAGKHLKGTGESPKVCQTRQDPLERSGSLIGDKVLVDSSPTFSTKDRSPGSLKRAHGSSDPKHRSLVLETINKRHGTDARLFQESVELRDKTNILEVSLKGMVRENASKVVSETCSRPSVGGNTGQNRLVNGTECREDKKCGSVQGRETGKDNDISDSSMVDSVSVLDISPDDVVGVIGEKHFWKARRAIVNQQRVFAVQVFELHRLVKVQKLIAGSPNLLLEDSLSLGKPSTKGSLAKKLSSESVLEPSPVFAKPRNDSQKPNAETECRSESAFAKIPLPPVNEDISKGLARSFYTPYSGTQPVPVPPPPPPLTPNAKPSPWYIHPPPGNQWLVPIMSPSEGFVYKPYTGAAPPNPSFMTPLYGNYDPMNPTARNGEFLNPGYGGIGILPGASPMNPAYFPPYGMHVLNPSASGSAVEQVISPFAKAQSGHENENQLPNVHINSCNMSSQMSRAVSCSARKRASKESEVQGSTASSPSLRVNGEELPLFPMESDLNAEPPPASEPPQARVIKVVPHNPRSANESAARIFQFIQEARKQFD